MNPRLTSHLPPTDMQLMLCDLPPADAARLRAFLRLGSERLRNRWSIGSDGNVQLVFYGGESPSTIPGTLDAAPYLVRVLDAGAPTPGDAHTLVRPLEFEAVIDAMAAAEAARQRPQGGPTAPLPVRADTPARTGGPAPAEAGAPLQRPPTAPAPQAAPAAPAAPAAAATPAPFDLHVRLKRWPQANLLSDWRYGIRMASFMSTRFVTVRELAGLSNVGVDECAQFVGRLVAADLVRVRDDAGAPAAAASGPTLAPPTPLPAETVARRGLLGRLRDKLGLGLRPAGATDR